MKVKNMTSSRTGREVANQFIIVDGNKTVFQSYQSTICIINYDKEGADRIVLGADWNYSRTTLKYLYQFLDEYSDRFLGWNVNKKVIENAIKNKDITYNANLY